MAPSNLVEVSNLTIAFGRRSGDSLVGVRDVNWSLDEGAALGIVGESGSGKSLTALALLGLLPRNAQHSGSVRVDGQEMLSSQSKEAQRVRARTVGMVMQDPTPSLNPLRTIRSQMSEAAHVAGLAESEHQASIAAALEAVHLDPGQIVSLRPHELSGGMNQRVVIAMALIKRPRLLIADEPTTALDVTTQASILNLLKDLRNSRNMGLVLISHDIGVVHQLVDTVAVMYAGRLVETGPTDEVIRNPQHPYTAALVAALPRLSADTSELLTTIPGQLEPSPLGDPGCPFRTRCSLAVDACSESFPEPSMVGAGHSVSCWVTGPANSSVKESVR